MLALAPAAPEPGPGEETLVRFALAGALAWVPSSPLGRLDVGSDGFSTRLSDILETCVLLGWEKKGGLSFVGFICVFETFAGEKVIQS